MEERNSNVEFLRIIAMMGIVALHYVNGDIGGLEKYADSSIFVWAFVSGIRSIAIPLVNVFVLISGYYMIRSTKFSFRKSADLLIIVFYHGFFLYIGFSLFSNSEITMNGILKNLFPFFYGSAWFIKNYIVLLLFVPFLNKTLTVLSMESYRRLLLIQLFLFSLWYSIGFSPPLADDGYGIINFITLYIIGGYIRRFGCECEIITKIKSTNAFVYFCVCVFLTAFASWFINPFGYAFITNILGASLLFLAVIKMRNHYYWSVNLLANYAFDVYFVHTYLFPYLGVGKITGGVWLFPHLILIACSCYLVGFFCGCLRKAIMKRTVNKLFDRFYILNKDYFD